MDIQQRIAFEVIHRRANENMLRHKNAAKQTTKVSFLIMLYVILQRLPKKQQNYRLSYFDELHNSFI